MRIVSACKFVLLLACALVGIAGGALALTSQPDLSAPTSILTMPVKDLPPDSYRWLDLHHILFYQSTGYGKGHLVVADTSTGQSSTVPVPASVMTAINLSATTIGSYLSPNGQSLVCDMGGVNTARLGVFTTNDAFDSPHGHWRKALLRPAGLDGEVTWLSNDRFVVVNDSKIGITLCFFDREGHSIETDRVPVARSIREGYAWLIGIAPDHSLVLIGGYQTGHTANIIRLSGPGFKTVSSVPIIFPADTGDVNDRVLSPDGTRIAWFTREFPPKAPPVSTEQQATKQTEIFPPEYDCLWVSDLSGKDMRLVCRYPESQAYQTSTSIWSGRLSNLAWTPDSKSLSVMEERLGMRASKKYPNLRDPHNLFAETTLDTIPVDSPGLATNP